MFRNASKSLTTSDEVYEYALSLLDRREHGEKELVQKLKRRCSHSEMIRETVAKPKEYDLLNEERYARRVFESWRARKVYGRLHLQAELIKKQVSEAYIPVILDSSGIETFFCVRIVNNLSLIVISILHSYMFVYTNYNKSQFFIQEENSPLPLLAVRSTSPS